MTGDFTSVPLRDGDPWSGTLLQQGRVLLDGDWNLNVEAAARDRQRLALQAIGPAGVLQGTSGFQIGFAGGALQIGAGSMWIGGLYAANPAPLAYSKQESIAPLPASGRALVYLDAFVQQVQAAEDPGDLLDPALDGIDTTVRTRVAWRVRAVPVEATDCSGAEGSLPAALLSSGRLDITPTTPGVPADLCAPPDDPRGKLPDGLLRVEVLDSGSEATARFAWSYENGAAAVAATVAGPQVTLAPSPSVSFFQNDLVEVSTLQRRADRLPAGPLFTVADVQPGAAGAVVTLSSPSTVTGTPAGLCLRRWDGQTVGAAAPVAATLGGRDVGIAFTARPGSYLAGDWWVTRVRGSSAVSVDKLTAAPPDGTQHYVAPLAVVDLSAGTVLSDCRPQFPPLTSLQGGCCTVEVRPSDVGGGASLHSLIAQYAGQGPVTFCLAPGTYTLSEPIVLGAAMNGVTLQGCDKGVVLQAPAKPGSQFTLGLIAIEDAESVTLRGLELSVPLVGFAPPADAFKGLPSQNQALLQAYANGLDVGIGVYVARTDGLTVEDCAFTFSDPGQANLFGAGIYAAGAITDAKVTGCDFESAAPPSTVPFYDLTAGNQTEPPYQLMFGYLQVADLPDPGTPPPTFEAVLAPAARSVAAEEATKDAPAAEAPAAEPPAAEGSGAEGSGAETPAADAVIEGASDGIFRFGISQLLHDLVIEGCLFQGVTVPVFAMTQLGTMRLDKNTVRDCYGGFWFYAIDDSSQLTLFDRIAIGDPGTFNSLAGGGIAVLAERIPPIASALVRVLPAAPPIAGFPVARRIAVPSAAELARARRYVTAYYAKPARSGATSGATSDATSGPVTSAAAAAAAKGVRLPRQLSAALSVPSGGNTVVVPPADPGTSVSPRLDVADCQIDAIVTDSYSGAALIMADFTYESFFNPVTTTAKASAVVHGNRMRSRFPAGQTVFGTTFAQAVISGNIIANEVPVPSQYATGIPQSYSLSLFFMAQPLGALAVAVSGNLLIDPPANLQSQYWQPLNTMVNYSEVPTVTGVSPSDGLTYGNETVVVTGTGFTSATDVYFGPNPGTALAIASDTELTVTSPAGNGAVHIIVNTPAGSSAETAADIYTYIPPPR